MDTFYNFTMYINTCISRKYPIENRRNRISQSDTKWRERINHEDQSGVVALRTQTRAWAVPEMFSQHSGIARMRMVLFLGAILLSALISSITTPFGILHSRLTETPGMS